MADNPIVFSQREMHDLLDGRMTQTRVVLKDVPPAPAANHPANTRPRHRAPYLDAYCNGPKTEQNPRGMGHWWNWRQVDGRACKPQFKVGVAPGDRLWVRETWKPHSVFAHMRPRDIPPTSIYCREAFSYAPSSTPWVRAMWMPRWASRFTLDVVDVKVERLQDISEKDAIASGILRKTWGTALEIKDRSEKAQRKRHPDTPVYWGPGKDGDRWSRGCWLFTADEAFERLWNREHGKDKWDDNPWVAAVTFRLIRANIDQVQP
jgi:hypothetical protein